MNRPDSSARHRRIRQALWVLVAIGFLASLRTAWRRWDAEVDNRRVEIALDYNELRTVSAADNELLPNGRQRSFSAVLKDFRDAGATSVAVEEDTIGGLEQARRLTIVPGTDRGATILRPLSAASSQRLVNALTHKTHFPIELIRSDSTSETDTSDVLVHEPINVVRAVGIGLDPMVTATIRDSGLSVVGRVGNYPGADVPAIDWTMRDLHDAGASTVIFTGEEVLGYSGPLEPGERDPNKDAVPDSLRADDLYYGTVEFGKQKGDVELQKLAPDRAVRVHTILGTEMVLADIPSNVQRFRLAARERNIRVLFVRLFLSEPRPVDTNVNYVRQIRLELARANMSRGNAHGYDDLHTSRYVRLLIGLGVAAGWLLLLDSVTRALSGELGICGYAVAVVPALILVGLSGITSLIGAKTVALAAGCIFPSLALLHVDALRSDGGSGRATVLVALARFAVCVAITFLGIGAIVGLLADRLFLLKADMFMGVKLVAVAPALVVAVVYGLSLRATPRRPWRSAVSEAGAAINRVATEPINLLQVVVALVALAALLLVVMRSGNDPGVGVSPLELKVREALDLVLPARPRFKDLAGHPALMIGFLLAAGGHRKWALPLLVVGAIGLASMLDAFCHLHTPLPISLARDFIAIGIGTATFLAIYAIALRKILGRAPAPATDA